MNASARSVGIGTRLLTAIATLGPTGRLLATRLDLLRELGIRGTYGQRTSLAASRTWAPAARRAIYLEIWQEAADEVGATLQVLDEEHLELHDGDRTTVVRFHHVQIDDQVSLELALDKSLAQRLLSEAGVPLPRGIEMDESDVQSGLEFLSDIAGPCVVKPARGTSGGSGVTCGVVTPDDFQRARLRASRWDDRMLLEQMVVGDEYRLLFLEGALLDVLRRRPPRVVGDGRSTVAALVEAENGRRAASGGRSGMSFLQVDLDCVLALRRGGWTLRSVPPDGTTVVLKSTANENAAHDNETVPADALAPALLADARRAVDAIGLRLAAVELMTPDPSRSLESVGGAILEVNGTPGLHYHALVADPMDATRVAVPILRRLLKGRPA